MTGQIRTEQPAPGIRLLRLDRAEKRNAIGMAMRVELTAALTAAEEAEDIAVILIAAAGADFSSGTDLGQARTLPFDQRDASWRALWSRLLVRRKPLIAAVEGRALGAGFELALACDMIVAADSAVFALPELRHGFLPGGGGTQRLVRAIGKARAMRAILAAQPLTAAEAEAMGLLSQRVGAGGAEAAAVTLALAIAAHPRAAVTAVRRLLAEGPDLPLAAALAQENAAMRALFETTAPRADQPGSGSTKHIADESGPPDASR